MKSTPINAPFWTSTRVALLTAFTGAVAYVVGVRDLTSSGAKIPESVGSPIYASKKEMEKVPKIIISARSYV